MEGGKAGDAKLDPETRETTLDYLAEHDNQKARDEGLSPFNRPQPLIPAE